MDLPVDAKPGTGHASFDLISALRKAEGSFQISVFLKHGGVACLVVGLIWAVWSTIVRHPYIIFITSGILCWLASAVACEAGLLASAPEGVQDLLLKRSPFDIIVHDDAPFVNLARRWGRMLLLSYRRNPAEVEHVVDGLQPKFVTWVFRRNLELLPNSVQRALLPEAAGTGIVAAVEREFSMAAPQLAELLDHKHEEREHRYVEPPIGPVVCRLVMQGLPTEVKYLLAGIALPGYLLSLWEYLVAFGLCGWATRLCLRTSAMRTIPLARALFPMLGATANVTLDEASARTARTMSAMGFIGAGAFIVHALYSDGVLKRMWKKDSAERSSQINH
mmetsp:Transcript_25424/g.59167  ORF Transcript_25424/g.59167 Transcript_25424/m.59167 type:complete len:334 (+) Transcript_25424:34-1035(+)